MIWGVLALVIFLLGILPVGVNAVYSMDGAAIRLILGPVRLLLFPNPKKEKQPREKKPVTKKELPKKQKEQGGSVKDFYPLVGMLLEFLGELRTKLRVDYLQLKLILAGDDPGDLAINYGRAWAALGNLIPQLERAFVIKKRDMEVACDFEAASTKIYARIDVTITVARILSLGLRNGYHIIKEYLKIMNERKGGAKL